LQPGTGQGKKTLAEVKRKMSHKLSVLALRSQAMKLVPVVKRMNVQKHVSEKQIVAAMKSDDLPKALQLAQIYQRDGGKGADKLLALIQRKMAARAARLFAKGSNAFAQEKLDLAIGYWRGATLLQPETSEYRDALRRARQLKERLSLLREQKQAASPR